MTDLAPFVRRTLRAASLLALLPILGGAAAVPPSVDELVAKHVAALGGEEKLRGLRSTRMTAKLVNAGGSFRNEAEYAELVYREKVRSEYTLQGMTAIQAWDGAEGWSLSPFGGRRDPETISPEDAKGLIQSAEIGGPLFDWRARGHRVEYLGLEDVDGDPAHKLRIDRKDGDTVYVFLDPDLFLEVRRQSVSRRRGTESRSESDFGAYERVDGVMFPFTVDSGAPDGPRFSHVIVQRVETNVAVDESLFRMPTKEKPAGRAVLAGPAAKGKPAAVPTSAPTAPSEVPLSSGSISGLGIRNIGPAVMSGRISAVAARAEAGRTTIFVGAASGGVWKSIDGGTTFRPVFDKMPVQSIGALALDPSDPKVVWAGTGEPWTRNSVSIGDGIYKSTDAGESWKAAGLPESERVVRILVHPKKSETVWACVPGKLWSDSDERGVFRTDDGGKSWAKILAGGNGSTGCSSLALDPENADVLFAGMWDFRRRGWTFRSGGETPDAASGSGLFRTADGGKSWTALDRAANAGLPEKPWGRIELAIAPSDAKRVYAFVEAKDSALYVSNDGGRTFEARDRSQGMVWRPFYFARLVVDPKNPDRLFKMGGGLIVSDDAGKSFTYAGGGSHGDWHDLWIDPTNTQHVVGGDDGGLWISHEGGNRWWKGENLPLSQFYHVSVDARDPYRVYGGLQDNGSWMGDSAVPGGVASSDWDFLLYGDGFWVEVDRTDPEIVYAEYQGGNIARHDRRTRAVRDIQPKAGVGEKLRFNWNAPLRVSGANGGAVYLGAQFLFRSKDKGETWDRISPDLTTNDPEKQKQEQSGGVSIDNSSAEMHCSIYAIAESPRDANVLWVGTDDGNVQLTRDAGKSWTLLNPNIPGLPPASWVSWIEPGVADAATAFVAFDRHTFGDMTPLVYRTTDSGRSFSKLVGAESGVRGYAHVIRQDPAAPGILYLGTELGIWISLDAGKSWLDFRPDGFPRVAVRDIAIQEREHDLVLATHGRGIWIVDDLTPLRAFAADASKPISILPGRPVQQRMGGMGSWVLGDNNYAGDDAPGGARIAYSLRSRPLLGRTRIEIRDAAGKVVEEIAATKRRGLNRVSWSMREQPPRVPRAAQLAYSATQGPRVLPGTYTVRVTSGSEVAEAKLEVGLDRRAPYGIEDRKAQHAAVLAIRDLFGEMTDLVDRINAARTSVEARIAKLSPNAAGRSRLSGVLAKVDEQRMKIVATKEGGQITGEERIREHLDTLYGAVNGYEGRPPAYQMERLEALRTELRGVADDFHALVERELPELREKRKKKT